MAPRYLGIATNNGKGIPDVVGGTADDATGYHSPTSVNAVAVGSGHYWDFRYYDPVAAAAANGFDPINGPFDKAIAGETLFDMGYFSVSSGGMGAAVGSTFVGWFSDTPGEWLRVRIQATTNVTALYYNSGTAGVPVWTQLGATFLYGPAGTAIAWVLRLYIDPAGLAHVAEFFVSGASAAQGQFAQAGLTNIYKRRCYGNGTITGYHSAMGATVGISLVGAYVQRRAFTGAGNYTAWTGTFADVDDAALNTADVNTVAANNQLQSYVTQDVTVTAGFSIGLVEQGLVSKTSGVAPTNIQGLYRTGGVDTLSSNLSGVGVGFSGQYWPRTTEPGSALPWTKALFDAAEWGFKSIA